VEQLINDRSLLVNRAKHVASNLLSYIEWVLTVQEKREKRMSTALASLETNTPTEYSDKIQENELTGALTFNEMKSSLSIWQHVVESAQNVSAGDPSLNYRKTDAALDIFGYALKKQTLNALEISEWMTDPTKQPRSNVIHAALEHEDSLAQLDR
jgi:hypothetical protein